MNRYGPDAPFNSRSSLPLAVSQSRTLRSLPPVASSLPSGLTAMARTQPRWASIVRIGLGEAAVVSQTTTRPSPPPL